MSGLGLSSVTVALAVENRSTHYARNWLESVGVTIVGLGRGDVELVAGGETVAPSCRRVTLWDYQVAMAGTGYQASAISGVSWVIGLPGRPPLALQADIPEKWCGLLGATLALATLLAPGADQTPVDVSAADILRAFADQNAGNHSEIPGGWSRNGRVAVEHGGIFPQGFYACADGYVGIVARSRADWLAILAALGNPDWSTEEAMRDPFALAGDDRVVGPRFTATLQGFTRDQLLERAIETGATLAPVYGIDEADARGLARDGVGTTGQPHLPFAFLPWATVRGRSPTPTPTPST